MLFEMLIFTALNPVLLALIFTCSESAIPFSTFLYYQHTQIHIHSAFQTTPRAGSPAMNHRKEEMDGLDQAKIAAPQTASLVSGCMLVSFSPFPPCPP
jgi:hypothetical protein